MGSVVDSYIESVKMLPQELRKNFRLIRDLDAQSQEIQRRLEETLAARLAELKERADGGTSNGEKALGKEGAESQIERDQEACAQIAERKVTVAEQTYNLVDKHIRRLDNDLHRLQAEVKAERAAKAAHTSSQAPGDEQPGPALPESNGDAQALTPGGQHRKRVAAEGGTQVAAPDSPIPPPVELDLPVDPNEPTYCYCQRVSYGEMVGCDNQDCPIGWFHFECVGLTTKPRGKWYCPDCLPRFKRKRTK